MIRVEWMNVAHPTFGCEVVPKGTETGQDAVTEELGIVLAADSIVVVEGSAQALLDGVEAIARQLRDATETRQGPRASSDLDTALQSWGEAMDGIVAGPFDWESCSFTCGEADAMATLLRVLGYATTAERLIGFHAAYDEEEDTHYTA